MAKVKVPPGMPLRWKRLVKELAPFYPSKNRGFPDSRRRVYAAIAQMHGVSVGTVKNYMSRTMLKREYARERGRLTRHLDLYLPQVFNGDADLPLNDISKRLQERTGISVGGTILEKSLEGYQGKPRGPPLIPSDETGKWRLNPSYYTPLISLLLPYQGNEVSREDQTQPA